MQGWHPVESGTIIWDEPYQSQMQTITSSWAPYLFRLTAILRNTHLDCQILNSDEGQKILDKIEKVSW